MAEGGRRDAKGTLGERSEVGPGGRDREGMMERRVERVLQEIWKRRKTGKGRRKRERVRIGG